MTFLQDYALFCTLYEPGILNIVLTTIVSSILCITHTFISYKSISHLTKEFNTAANRKSLNKNIYILSKYAIISLTLSAWCHLFFLLWCEIAYYLVNILSFSLTLNEVIFIGLTESVLVFYHWGLVLLALVFLYRLYFIFTDSTLSKYSYPVYIYKILLFLFIINGILYTFGSMCYAILDTSEEGFLITGISNLFYSFLSLIILGLFIVAMRKVTQHQLKQRTFSKQRIEMNMMSIVTVSGNDNGNGNKSGQMHGVVPSTSVMASYNNNNNYDNVNPSRMSVSGFSVVTTATSSPMPADADGDADGVIGTSPSDGARSSPKLVDEDGDHDGAISVSVNSMKLGGNINTLPVNINVKKINKSENKLINTMIKYTVLALIAFVFTSFIAVISFVRAYIFSPDDTSDIAILITTIIGYTQAELIIVDCGINVVCLILQFSFEKENYKKYCHKCHSCAKRMFGRFFSYNY